MSAEGNSSTMWQSTIITCVFFVCATVAWMVYEINRHPSPCVEEVHEPNNYFTHCSDPRAKITTPPGWTWFRCECPEGSR